MKTKILIPLVLAWLGSSLVFGEDTVQITQAKTGRSLEVTVVEVSEGILSFESNGRKYDIAISTLTPESVERLKLVMEARKAPSGDFLESASKLNEKIGHDLMGDVASLWKEDAGQIAERLGWRLESKKKDSSSYRLYTQPEYLFLGAHPYCVTLYGGQGGTAERFSLVYANKGDYGSRFGMGEDHFKKVFPDKEPPQSLDDAIDFDATQISSALTSALGEPDLQYYGERDDKRRVKRWNLGDHAFLLSSLEDEYTSLVIVPKEDADAQGRIRFVADRIMKEIQLQNVVRSENGDVWIDNIPMVDQGPKGYCAPATFERAMRYMSIPADMYLLAVSATVPDRGTNTTKLADDCKRIVLSKARRIRDLNLKEEFDFKTIGRYIDKGVPVLWQMCSLGEYNKVANDRSKERESVSDFKQWATEISGEAEGLKVPLSQVSDNHHICMIIGYNEKTNEVAVSDSWGPNYELRWVHIDIARAVTNRGGFVIDF